MHFQKSQFMCAVAALLKRKSKAVFKFCGTKKGDASGNGFLRLVLVMVVSLAAAAGAACDLAALVAAASAALALVLSLDKAALGSLGGRGLLAVVSGAHNEHAVAIACQGKAQGALEVDALGLHGAFLQNSLQGRDGLLGHGLQISHVKEEARIGICVLCEQAGHRFQGMGIGLLVQTDMQIVAISVKLEFGEGKSLCHYESLCMVWCSLPQAFEQCLARPAPCLPVFLDNEKGFQSQYPA